MSFKKFVTSVDSNLLDACQKIQANNCRAIVIENAGKLFGILTEGDVMRAFIDGARNVSDIRDYVNISPKTYPIDTSLLDIKFMQSFMEGITLIPIVDEDMKILGVKTIFGEYYADQL